MNEDHIKELLDKVMNGELSEYHVSKEEFLPVRNVIVRREDFKNFRGIAQRGGGVIYKYMEKPRS
ncbi:hypothetical protein ACFYKT_16940 [Cytobacillus sp. FJAT-53684]|uniref:Abortive phage infection protein n=1 Tax=Cytobacillus mangrovibacter TaxID=3299024 RepID=A0ABW6K403_9BACI